MQRGRLAAGEVRPELAAAGPVEVDGPPVGVGERAVRNGRRGGVQGGGSSACGQDGQV